MKQMTILAFLWLNSLVGITQSLVGEWEGLLSTETRNLPILLFVQPADTMAGIQAQFQSPRQTSAKIKFNQIRVRQDSFQLVATAPGVTLEGTIQSADSSLQAQWKQGGRSYSIRLVRFSGQSRLAQTRRPQTPKPPFPYRLDSVTIPALYSSIHFGGTLTQPHAADKQNPVPALLLLSGSGPSDRDESILGHKPFAVLADALTRDGYAVLRVDDRGVGKSTGKHYPATTHDFSLDAEAAFQWLRQQPGIDSLRCGLAGHSEGGLIAAMLAARVPSVGFVISLAGPGVRIIQLMGKQNQDLLVSRGVSAAAATSYRGWYERTLPQILAAPDTARARQLMVDAFQAWRTTQPDTTVYSITGVNNPSTLRTFVASLVQVRNNVWFRYFLEADPRDFWKEVRVPVLAINGTRDIQVSAQENLRAIQRTLRRSGNRKVQVKALEGLNHLFQRCQFCTVEEYGDLEETMNEQVPKAIVTWLDQHIKSARK